MMTLLRSILPVLWVLVLTSGMSVAQRPDAPEYGQTGPYAVGTRELLIEDDTRPLIVTVWYPAERPENGERARYRVNLLLSATGDAYRDAPALASEGAYPLVVYSHGSGGSRLFTLFLMEHLASHGFFVIAADHPGNAFDERLNNSNDFPGAMALRPDDVLRKIAFAEMLNAGGDFAGLIDLERIGVGGHSFGGLTALQAGGARLNTDQLVEYCEAPPENENICFLTDDIAAIAAARGLESVPDGNWPALTDTRIKAVAAYAPWNAPILDTSTVTSPTMILTGDADDTAPLERDALEFYERLATPRHLGVFQLADHNIFIDECPDTPIIDALFAACSDPVWDMERAHDLINHLTTTFFMLHLYEDAGAADALMPEAVGFRGIVYEVEGYSGEIVPVD